MANAPAPPSEEIWRAMAERAIGESIETLESRSADGLPIKPLYRRRPVDSPQPWHARRDWDVAQRVDHPDPGAANRLALIDLEGGTDALVLVGAQSPYRRGFGVALTADEIPVLLGEVELDLIGLRLDAGPQTTNAVAALAQLVAQRHLASAALAVDIGFDPIGWEARLGAHTADDEAHHLAGLRDRAGLAGSLFMADGRPWHEAGAAEAQELAAVLATAVAYLRCGESLGYTLDEARKSVSFLLAADADVFLGLAKFRAMRRLWARVEAASGLTPAPMRLLAETSWRMMTHHDPWTNAMRTCAATFAAGLGGAECITVLPFTTVRGLPDAAARRLARNTQRVLLDEAHLGAVVDPAAGAGSFETLTEALCTEAWRHFQDIEREGGMEREEAGARLKACIARTARARADQIGSLAIGIVGTSRHTALGAFDAGIMDEPPRPASAKAPGALPVIRDAAPFETLRARAEAAEPQPRAFLAVSSAASVYGPLVTQATQIFAAAGITVLAPSGEPDIDAQIAAFESSSLAIVCLCLPNTSPVGAATIASRFRQAGAACILSIGARRGAEGCADIDAYLRDGSDILHTLGQVVGDTRRSPSATPLGE